MIYADPDSQNNLLVQLILTLLIITYGLNRIFRHAQSDTVNRSNRNDVSDTVFLRDKYNLSTDQETSIMGNMVSSVFGLQK
jgi:hypothetical protein